jgi:hypothetical protein
MKIYEKIDYFLGTEIGMPRSSHSSSSRVPAKVPVAPVHTSTPSAPSTGQIIKESIVSGVGSGIGFGIGSRLVSGMFGAPVVSLGTAVTETKSAVNTFAQTTIPNLQQCQQNAFDATEKTFCYALLSKEPRHHEFKQCMETSDNQVHVCKEFLPKE